MNKQHIILPDVPAILLKDVMNRRVQARIISTQPGVVAGIEEMVLQAKALGLEVVVQKPTGKEVFPGDVVASFLGNPLQIVRGEECLLGIISKVSGIATAARQAVALAGKVQVVSGGWKKVPREVKDHARRGLMVGGVALRMLAEPFVYLDKNYLRIFGSHQAAISAAAAFPERSLVLQIRGRRWRFRQRQCWRPS